MTDVKRMERVRLGIFHHDAFRFWFTPPEIRARGENFIHNSTSVIGCLVIDVEIALHRVHTADSLHASDLILRLAQDDAFDLFRHLLRSRRDGFPRSLARARFIRRRLKK